MGVGGGGGGGILLQNMMPNPQPPPPNSPLFFIFSSHTLLCLFIQVLYVLIFGSKLYSLAFVHVYQLSIIHLCGCCGSNFYSLVYFFSFVLNSLSFITILQNKGI